MTPLLWRSERRQLGRHPLQSSLSILGIALGVAVVVAIRLTNTSALAAFELSTEAATGASSHQILGGPAGLGEAVYTDLRHRVPEAALAPVVEARVALPASPGRFFRLLGLDPFAEARFRPYLSSLGRGEVDGAAFLSEPGAAVLAAGTARRLGLAPGDPFPAVYAGRTARLVLAGTFSEGDGGESAAEDLLLVDLATAQEVTGTLGLLTRIEVAAAEGAEGGELLDRLRRALPPATTLVEVATRSAAAARMSRAFRLNLTALSLLALLCGAFLIFNTMTFAVVERRPQLGTLRALGTTRREVLALVLGEAGLLGLAGTALGLAGGIALSRSLVRLVAQTVNDFYFSATVERTSVDAGSLLLGAALGLGGTLLAALPPALEATGIPPRAVLLRSVTEQAARRRGRRLLGAGLAFGLLGAGLLLLPGKRLEPAFLGLAAVMLGLAALAPAATLLFARLARPLAGALFGLPGRMAAGGVEASLSRTGIAVASLMVAVSATVGIGLMIASFRGSLVAWLEATLAADVYIAGDFAAAEPPLSPDLTARLESVPGVAHANALLVTRIPTATGDLFLQALELGAGRHPNFVLREGDPAAVWPRFERGEVVLVSEPLAFRRGLAVGSPLELRTAAGPETFEVGGVYLDFSTDQGSVTFIRSAFDRAWPSRGTSAIALFLVPGASPEAVIAECARRAAAAGQTLEIRSTHTIKQHSLEVFDRTFAITGVLRWLAGLVAAIGVLSALMALALERRREFGLLRALGLTPRQLGLLVTGQSGLLGLAAGLFALPAGMVMAALMVYVVNRRSFGWTMALAIDAWELASGLALALGAALAAGLYPALTMARTPAALDLREE